MVVVLDEILKSKALACLVFSNLLLILVRGNKTTQSYARPEKLFKREVVHGSAQFDAESILKTDRQITVQIPGKQIKVLQYFDVESGDHNLSVTVIPCSATIKWSLLYRTFDEIVKESNSTSFNGNEYIEGDTYEMSTMETVTIEKSKKGLYLFVFHPLGYEASAAVFVTLDYRGPYALTMAQKPKIVVTPQRRQRLKITWDQSLINPQNTSYCLVVSTEREHPSLCGAEEKSLTLRTFEGRVTVNLSNLNLNKRKRGKFARIHKGLMSTNDTVVVCVDRRTQLTLTKLKRGVKYYFNLFAINNKTNLTIPYGKSFIRYNFTVKPINLRDGIRKAVDLKKLEGKAIFRYKVVNATKGVHLYVLVCGGAVDVELRSKLSRKDVGERQPRQTRVFGYKRFRIAYPTKGEQLYLKVNAPNVDELSRIKYVEVFMTVHPGRRYPLPLLPDEPNLYEFKSQKTCNSVTIGWVPMYDTSINTYCVVVWENRKWNYADVLRGYFQCNLDELVRKTVPFSHPKEATVSKKCEDMITTNKISITNYKIRGLKPKTSYTVQVTVKKKHGRTLSYKYLKTFTKHSCRY